MMCCAKLKDMGNLDDPGIYASLDPSGMRDRLRDLPRQCWEAWCQARSVQLPTEAAGRKAQVVICGMGGSAIAGDLVANLASLQGTVPISVAREFHLPFALDGSSLVIVCSYSGNTQETLSMFRQALRTEAQVMVVAGGGTLAQEASAKGIPLFTMGLPGEARSAVGYSLVLLLGVLQRLDLVKTGEAEVNLAIEALQDQVSRLVENAPIVDNEAKRLALELQGKLILVYGGGIFSGLARRWKTQLNENAKTWAFFESIPELLHNSIEAHGSLPGISEHITALLLQPNNEEKEMALRYGIITEALQKSGVSHWVLKGTNDPPLAQLLNMLLLGDYVSYYLALLNGKDPSPTPNIVFAKERLSDPFPWTR